jgi:histidine kinase
MAEDNLSLVVDIQVTFISLGGERLKRLRSIAHPHKSPTLQRPTPHPPHPIAIFTEKLGTLSQVKPIEPTAIAMPLLPHLPGYQVTEHIHQSSQTILYSAVAEDGTACILKTIRAEFPTSEQIARLKHEYHIIADLDLPGVIQPIALEIQQNQVILVIEDIGGRSLKHYIQNNSVNLEIALSIACQIARTLADLHQHQITHKDIKPANIIFNPHSGIAKLSDFTLATRLSTETTSLLNPNQLEGTLAYLSPEQTGRMNRSIDYRTDFYAFGVTLYELFSGQLPFQSQDPLVLIHSHIAKAPPPLPEALPSAIAEIIAKLMAKNAEDRYQSASGLVADLEQCLSHYQNNGSIPNFEIGKLDRISQLNIPQKLYGRERAAALLQNAFAQACTGALEVVVISGYSGIGKTALVQELFKALSARRGYFVSGKCDQFKRDVPLGAVTESYRGLMRQILAESPAEIAQWRSRFQTALGDNAQVVINLIPELELIIGPAPLLREIDHAETQQRFWQTFNDFFECLASGNAPIIHFMDDLQWADTAGLNSLAGFANNPNIHHHLLILAYRENEVDPTHPLIQAIAAIQAAGKAIHSIHLAPLDPEDVNHLVADTLSDRPETTAPLAHLLHRKTQGNPFFLIQLLKSLWQKEILRFDYATEQWQWNIQEIQQQGITDNVIDLMIEQLSQLGDDTQTLIQIAACIGHQFDLNTLASILGQSAPSTCKTMLESIQTGFIIPLDQVYKIVVTQDETGAFSQVFNPKFKFLHDRVQQAAYEMIDRDRIPGLHWRIGQLLLEGQRDLPLFNLVHHLNQGLPSDISEAQRIQLIDLNQQAAHRARSAMGISAAFEYIQQAIDLLQVTDWEREYDRTLDLYSIGMEIAYAHGQLAAMEAWYAEVDSHAREAIDCNAVQRVKIQSLITAGQLEDAIRFSQAALAQLGFILPDVGTEADIAQALQATIVLVADHPLKDWVNLSPITDRTQLAIARLLTQILALAYIHAPTLLPLISLAHIQILLKFGRFPDDAISCANYAFLVNLLLKDPCQAYALAEVAQQFMAGNPSQELRTRANITLGGLVIHHTRHLKETCPLLMEGYHAALAVGSAEFTTYHAGQFIVHHYLLGHPITETYQTLQDFQAKIDSLDAISAVNYNMVHQLALSTWLQPLSTIKAPASLADSINITGKTDDIVSGFGFSTICFHQLILYYTFGEYRQAIEIIDQAPQFMPNLVSTVMAVVIDFYGALALLADFPWLDVESQSQRLQRISSHIERLEFAALHGPMNHQHKLLLVKAERSHGLGQIPEAMQYYQQAIELAGTHGYIQEQAIACERAAEFYGAISQPAIAQMYRHKAHGAYCLWGARLKVETMEAQYPELQRVSRENSIANGASTTGSQETIDLTTVIQASQILAGEIVLERLVEKLLGLARENAGAQKVVFISKVKEQLVIEACLNPEELSPAATVDIAQHKTFPQALIHYVIRTKEALVLDHAMNDRRFNYDRYLQEQQPMSVAVVPILQQNEVMGVLYLENNLTVGAFTRDRCEVLGVIAAQAAISLENAQLYATMEHRINQRTQELSTALEQLKTTQIRLIQSEKMSSLGQLVAGIAHEINNPINFIYGNLSHAEVYARDLLQIVHCYQAEDGNLANLQALVNAIDLDYIVEDFPKVLQSMKYGADRVQEIVQGLRDFARLDETAYKTANIHDGLESTLNLVTERLGAIAVIKNYSPLPDIDCYAAELNQVFLNLITNAIDALENRSDPTIKIQTSLTIDQEIRIVIEDNGAGIAEASIPKIFDPFFTTKPVGQGTGLGLAIGHQIITGQHGGRLVCRSNLGLGTAFEVLLPLGGRSIMLDREDMKSPLRTA